MRIDQFYLASGRTFTDPVSLKPIASCTSGHLQDLHGGPASIEDWDLYDPGDGAVYCVRTPNVIGTNRKGSPQIAKVMAFGTILIRGSSAEVLAGEFAKKWPRPKAPQTQQSKPAA